MPSSSVFFMMQISPLLWQAAAPSHIVASASRRGWVSRHAIATVGGGRRLTGHCCWLIAYDGVGDGRSKQGNVSTLGVGSWQKIVASCINLASMSMPTAGAYWWEYGEHNHTAHLDPLTHEAGKLFTYPHYLTTLVLDLICGRGLLPNK